MKTIRKMITVYTPIWKDYKNALKKKAFSIGDPALTPSSDLSQYMKEEAKKWK